MSFRRMRHMKARQVQGCVLALDAVVYSSLYDATTGGSLVAADGAVARWEDLSGNANHATQGTAGTQPLRKVASVAGNDSILFDGSNDILSLVSSITRPNTINIVAQRVSILGFGNYQTILATTVGSGLFHRLSSSSALGMFGAGVDKPTTLNPANNTSFSISVISQSGDTKAYGGSSSATIASGAYTQSGPSGSNSIGGEGGARFANARICEISAWSSIMSLPVNQRVRHASMRKWRING